MGRRIIFPKKEMWAMRASNWEFHYANRRLAQMYPEYDRVRAVNAIMREVPEPEMIMNGALLDGIENLRGTNWAIENLMFMNTSRHLMCIWYWSGEGWMELVRRFQRLPEITHDYYLIYDKEYDAVRYAPSLDTFSWGGNRRDLAQLSESRKLLDKLKVEGK